MRSIRFLLTLLGLLWGVAPVFASDNTLLIQLVAGGGYRVWHQDGVTHLSEDELLGLAALASTDGSAPRTVSAGTARAYQTEYGVVIELVDAVADRRLLIDRDECGAIKVWHADGETQLSDDQLTELVMSALPGGGKRVNLGDRSAKAFVTSLGYTVVIWQPVRRP